MNESPGFPRRDGGFGIVEFMIAGLIFVVISAGIFEVLARTQRYSAYQEEIHGVLESTRFALAAVERIIHQAGNNPSGAAFAGIIILSATEVRIISDLTGSAGPGEPDKGDPDGDVSDSGEDVTIRYNAGTRSLELVGDAGAQPIASLISSFSMQYLDQNGAATMNGNEVFRVRISLTGTSQLADPYTRKPFSIQLAGDIPVASRF